MQKMEYKLVSDEGILTLNICNSYTVFGAIEGHDVWYGATEIGKG